MVRRLTDMQKELDLLVHTLATYPEMNNPIKMEVGIEECLHIEFEYNKSKYHLKDVIVGKIYFLLVRIKIRYMEVAIIKRETTGSGPNTFHDNETIAKYELMIYFVMLCMYMRNFFLDMKLWTELQLRVNLYPFAYF